MDAFYLLLIAEFALILLVLTILFRVRAGKYRKLYEKALNKTADSGSSEDLTEAGKGKDRLAAGRGQDSAKGGEEDDLSEGTGEDDASLKGKVRKLNRIVNFQKNKIVDLMGYKDMMESVGKRLTSIHQSNEELNDKIKTLAESSDHQEDFTLHLASFEKNNNELSSFIRVLDKDNKSLSDKFGTWEIALKDLWEQAESGEGVDEGMYTEAVEEKEELVSKLKDFEEKLQEKVNILGEMQKQYDDLETEYMVLYRQQQAAEGKQV